MTASKIRNGTLASEPGAPGAYDVRIKTFGAMEVENMWGHVGEKNPARPSLSWSILKYLLVNPGREISHDEMVATIWANDNEKCTEGAARVRLRRLREILAPLHLDGRNGLVRISAGNLYLNPDYNLLLDTEELNALVHRIRKCSLDDPLGLELCTDALELYRGRFFEHTREGCWLRAYREYYFDVFRELAYSTLKRMDSLDNDMPAALLSYRAAELIPLEKDFHSQLVDFLVKHNRRLELMRYVSNLSQNGGSGWLNSIA